MTKLDAITAIAFFHELSPEKRAELKKKTDFFNPLIKSMESMDKVGERMKNATSQSDFAEAEKDYIQLIAEHFKTAARLVEDIGSITGETGKKKSYRQLKNIPGAISVPDRAAIITLPGFGFASAFLPDHDDGRTNSAYLAKISNMDGLCFKDGVLTFSDNGHVVQRATLKNIQTKEGITDIDTRFLSWIYSILFKCFQESGYQADELRKTQNIRIEDFLGYHPSEKNINQLFNKAASYNNICGFIENKGVFQLLTVSFDTEKDLIMITSHYYTQLMETLLEKSYKKNAKGEIKYSAKGLPLRQAINSYMVYADVYRSCKNLAAIGVMEQIVRVIEQTGTGVNRVTHQKKVAHIAVATLIERNIYLKQQYEAANQKNKWLVLQRTFQKAWELLVFKTELSNKYEHLQIVTNESDEAGLYFDELRALSLESFKKQIKPIIPKIGNVKTLIFYFKQDGKKKRWSG